MRARAVKRKAEAQRVHRLKMQRLKKRPQIRLAGLRVRLPILQVREAGKKLQAAGFGHDGLRFLERGQIRQPPRPGVCRIQPRDDFLEHARLSRAHCVFAGLRPIACIRLALHLHHGNPGQGDRRYARRLFILRAKAQDRFRQQGFFPRSVINEVEAAPFRGVIRLLEGDVPCPRPFRLGVVAQHERVLDQRRVLFHFFARHRLLRVARGAITQSFVRPGAFEQIFRQRRAQRRDVRVVPEREQRVGLPCSR